MQAKRLVFPKKRTVEIESFDVSESPAEGEVLIENIYGLISPGTELAMYTETHVGFAVPEFKYAKYPFRPGYAAVGRALKVGSAVTNIKPGDTVISRASHASRATIAARKVPDGVDPRLAPLAFLGEIAAMAPMASEIQVGMDAVVFGQGMIGNLAAQWLRAAGARRVFVVDPVPHRLEVARQCGLNDTIDAKEDVVARIKELTGGNGCHVVIEATGVPAVAVTAIKCARKLGKVVLLGSPRGEATLNLYFAIHAPGISVVGGHANHLDAFSYAGSDNWADLLLEFASQGRIKLEPLISHTLSASEASRAYEGLLNQPADYLGVLLKLDAWQ